jgi:hypothetical protein
MDREILISVLGIIALMAVIGFVFWDRYQMCTAEIEGSLKRYHASDIQLKFDWLDFDRDTFTYDVTYRDSTGNLRHNRCKVATRYFGADNSVYWTEPLLPPPPNTR